ncbi:MAG: homocysteine S-methyltransferase family protein, partial [Endomicrobiia bacterium]|nr:homocysteine S-methyltransferase family protein [Endomicrobiia bacterium]
MKSFRDRLKSDIVFLDGAFGTYIQSLGLSDGDFGSHPGCMEHLVLSKPDLVARVHRDYLEAGSDAVETDTFGANAVKLAEYGLAGGVYEINRLASALARKEAGAYSTQFSPRYVIGTMGPTGKLPSSTDPVLGGGTYDELKKTFMEQALGIIDGGADALLVETGQDLLEMKAAVNGAKEAMRERARELVLMAQCTLANNGRMLLGTEVSAFMAVMANIGVDVIGLNCSMGPTEMEQAVKFLSENSPAYVSCVPNAGLPEEAGGRVVYPLGPEEMARIMARFARQYRLDVVGGCCGTTPEHIREMKKAISPSRKRTPPKYVFFASTYRG